MSIAKNIFEFLIAPISNNDFITKYWDKEFLYIPRDDFYYYSEILTISQMNDFLSHNNIRYPTIRLAKDGKEVPLDKYSNILSFGSYAAEGLINIDKLFSCYYDGATIVHQLMKYSINSLSKFTNALEKHFCFNVETTVYLTPENSQGFTAHYDTHSVFVLQICGSKIWRLYDNVKDLPTLDQNFVKAEYIDTEANQTIKLLPGDLLYVPRGLAHDAITTDGVSLHITVGVFPHLWLDYFKEGLQNLKEQVDFRKAPLNYLVGNEKEQEDTFNKLLDTFISQLSESSILQVLSDKVIGRQMKDNSNRLLNFSKREAISLSSKLKKRTQIVFKITCDEHKVYLTFYNKTLSFSIEHRKAIEFITTVKSFQLKDITGLPTDRDKIVFSKKLIEEGFLTVEEL